MNTSEGETVPNLEETPPATRPSNAPRKAARRNSAVQRYTVDLDKEQRRTLALYAAEWEVDKSRIVRTLLYLLEAEQTLRDRVQGELFLDEEETGETIED